MEYWLTYIAKTRGQESDLSLVNKKDKKFRKNRNGGIHKNFSDIQENDKCNFISNVRKNNLAVSTKSFICYVSKNNIEFSKKKIFNQAQMALQIFEKKGFFHPTSFTCRTKNSKQYVRVKRRIS